MAKNLINKYVWLVNTIYQAKKISLKEINRRWLDTDLSEGLEIPRRTFHTWKNTVEDMFGIVIMCDKSDGDRYYIENREALEDDGLQRWLLNSMSASNTLLENKSLSDRYYIENREALEDDGLQRWLLNSMSASNTLLENKSLSDRILLENIPSGQDFLETVMAAMKKSKMLEITYKGYWREHESTFRVAPYCVKLFRQRWYLVGNSVYEGKIRIYSLDRVLEAKLTEKPFKYPDDFSPEAYFEGCFGVIRGVGTEIETVKLKVRADQANYLRSLPLHHSQKELVRTGDYSVFSVEVRPTFDFRQELLCNGDALEVLEPLWLRKEMADMVKRMWNNYNSK